MAPSGSPYCTGSNPIGYTVSICPYRSLTKSTKGDLYEVVTEADSVEFVVLSKSSENLRADVAAWAEGAEQSDDITPMVVEYQK